MALALVCLLSAALDSATLLGAPLLPEGAAWNAPGVQVFESRQERLDVALAHPVRVSALLVQADFDDTYFVEGSLDGESFQLLWRVPPLPAPPGLRSRYTRLDPAPLVRHLRLRASFGPGAYSVARMRVWPLEPSPWPPELDHSLPGRGAPLFPWLTPARIQALRLALGGLALAAVAWHVSRPGPRSRRTLGLLAVVSLLAWANFLNFHFSGFSHGWELFHYYVGGKYAPELGYRGLYECTALADAEDGVVLPGRPIRDLGNDLLGTVGDAPPTPECRHAFDAERWRAFRADVRSFRGLVGDQWPQVLSDHGHNATPVWNLIGGSIASAVPSTPLGIRALACLDLLLLALAGLLVARFFGRPAASLAALFFGLNALSRFAWTGGAFLRYDWLALSLIGLVALRAGRPRLAGFALAWATLSRVFPVILWIGLVLNAAWIALLDGPSLAWRRLRGVVLGGALATLVLLPASVLRGGERAGWGAFLDNSRKYLHSEAENKLGLATALAFSNASRVELLYDPELDDPYREWKRARAENTRRTRPLRLLLSAAFLALLAAAVRGQPAWAAATLGCGLLPILFQQGNYYLALLAAFALLLPVSAAASAGLVGLAWASELAAQLWPALDVRAAALSTLVCAYVGWATWCVAREPRVSP
jgi:hypothetical protein